MSGERFINSLTVVIKTYNMKMIQSAFKYCMIKMLGNSSFHDSLIHSAVT